MIASGVEGNAQRRVWRKRDHPPLHAAARERQSRYQARPHNQASPPVEFLYGGAPCSMPTRKASPSTWPALDLPPLTESGGDATIAVGFTRGAAAWTSSRMAGAGLMWPSVRQSLRPDFIPWRTAGSPQDNRRANERNSAAVQRSARPNRSDNARERRARIIVAKRSALATSSRSAAAPVPSAARIRASWAYGSPGRRTMPRAGCPDDKRAGWARSTANSGRGLDGRAHPGRIRRTRPFTTAFPKRHPTPCNLRPICDALRHPSPSRRRSEATWRPRRPARGRAAARARASRP
ncbi:MAG: hypothetical protein JWN86_3272, partial [Planctomycetota bacterium]|nr:hypothetical protein [Planctomycetota bacterium]